MNRDYFIDRISIHWGEMPVKLTFSYGKVSAFSFMIVRLYAGGKAGTGEVLVPPNDFFKGYLPKLVGCDARRLDALLPATEEDYDRIVCEAVSIALYDLVGRVSGLPVRVLLGGSATDVVPLMPCIFPNTPEEAKERAEHWFSRGYRYLKMKLIGDFKEDLARIKAVRSIAPEGIVLQGDANCGYKTVPEALKALEEFGAAGLDVFEDPLEGGVDEYRRISGRTGAKVMVDALSRRTDDLAAVLGRGAADVVGIHPDQPGSLSRAIRHVRLAQSFNVPVVVGGTGYTAVGSAAYQQLTAVVTPGGPCGELGGFFDHGMPKLLVVSPLPMDNGCVTLPDTPGLGVELDEDALREFQTGQMEWRI